MNSLYTVFFPRSLQTNNATIFFPAVNLYYLHFLKLQKNLANYMKTSTYQTESKITSVKDAVASYTTYLKGILSELDILVQSTPMEINIATSLPVTNLTATTGLSSIYGETYFVSTRLNTAMQAWYKNCPVCGTSGRKRRGSKKRKLIQLKKNKKHERKAKKNNKRKGKMGTKGKGKQRTTTQNPRPLSQ